MTLLHLVAFCLSLVGVWGTPGNCTVYETPKSTHCQDHCGACFNPGGRAGVMCPGGQTGYYCPSAGPAAFMTYACMDWTFGSSALKKGAAAFKARTGEDVFFGLGTYGTTGDAQRGLGACYRLRANITTKEFLVQSINTGSDVSGTQFDLQVGDGGAGEYNVCAGSNYSMFPGDKAAWGHQYGGVDTRAECSALPHYPKNPAPMKAAGDDLVSFCQLSFDQSLRLDHTWNPTIVDVARVACPSELVEMTQMQRTDDPHTYRIEAEHRPLGAGFPNVDHECETRIPGGTTAYCLTRMMDCRKPSGAFKDNIKPELMVPGKKLVQTCTADGYSRIDVQCGCQDCYC